MAAIVVVSKRTSGTEADIILNELARWAEPSTIGVNRQPDRVELTFDAEGIDWKTAAADVENALNPINASWPIHVGIERPPDE